MNSITKLSKKYLIMTSKVEYKGHLRTISTHIKSGEQIITDAPIDNNGKGEAFSPTDMVANSVATCMLTIMGITAKKRNLNIDGTIAMIEKIMAANPRRISKLNIEVVFPNKNYTAEDKELLIKVALNCPVIMSIHPNIEKNVSFK